MLKGDKRIGLVLAFVLIATAAAAAALGLAGSAAEDEQAVGRYQVGAPDLILDTATGRLATVTGQLLEQALDPSGEEIGRYAVAGYMTTATRSVGLDVMNRPTLAIDLVKGYMLLDTKTGQVKKQRVYYSRPLQPGDL